MALLGCLNQFIGVKTTTLFDLGSPKETWSFKFKYPLIASAFSFRPMTSILLSRLTWRLVILKMPKSNLVMLSSRKEYFILQRIVEFRCILKAAPRRIRDVK